MNYNIKVNITPTPGGRPRVTRWSTFYPKKHTQYIKDAAKQGFICTPTRPKTPLETIVSINTTYVLPLPKSTSKKKRLEMHGMFCEKHIDLDNLDKIFWDEILVKGKIIKDDCQIVMNSSKKIWTSGTVGFTQCNVEELA